MKVTFLGTGTSSGVPVISCKCDVCRSLDYKDKRLRVSVLLQIDDKNIIIDTGPDFRQQVLNCNIDHLDAVLFTHEHKDHTAGLDDIRPFNYMQGKKYLPIYAHQRVIDQLKQEFHYAFQDEIYPGVPLIECHIIENKPFDVLNFQVIPIEVSHFNLQVFGFRVGDFTYITDANAISDLELEKAKGSKVLVLNALQKEPHISHFNLEQAIAVAQKIDAPKTYFTHVSHKLGTHQSVVLPKGIELAYDGLSFMV